MKVNAHLILSRHGAYYYRAIIPNSLKIKLGLSEIKRSLGTKDPKTAKQFAICFNALAIFNGFEFLKMLTCKDRQFSDFQNMLKIFQ